MNIDRNNYQAFILDYYEGNLSEEQAAILMSFLEKHPGLKEEFDEFEIIKLQEKSDNLKFNEKGLLKKPEPEYSLPVTAENFELFCIAELEGLLSDEEVAALDRFISQNPSFERTRKLYNFALAEPDNKVTYKGKESLKKEPVMTVAYKQITDENYEEFFSAYIDDALPVRQTEQLEAFLKDNPERSKEFSQWKKTKLTPDLSVVFPNKTALKKHQVGVVRKVWYSISAAAVVLIIASLFFMTELKLDNDLQYVDTTTPTTKPAEETVEPAKETPVIAEYQPEEVMIRKTEPEVSKTIKQEAIEEPFKVKPINTSLLAALPPRQITPTDEPSMLLAYQQSVQNEFPASQHVSTGSRDDDYTSITQLALAEFQNVSGLDVIPERFSLGDVAGAGLAAISRLTGRPLTVQKERNEEGNITYFAIGDSFKISRSRAEN